MIQTRCSLAALSQVVIDSCVAIRVRIKAYVRDTLLEKAFETDVTLRVLDVFRENGIEPPAVLHRSLNTTAGVEEAASTAMES